MTGITQRPGGFSYQRMTNVSPATWQVFSPAGRVAALTYSARDAERVADALGYQHPPAAAGEEIMVNAAHDVYTLPLQPSGLSSGPRFVVHVPAQEQPAVVDGRYRLVDDVVTVNGIALDEVVRLGDRYAAAIEKLGMPRASQVFEALVLIGKHALAAQQPVAVDEVVGTVTRVGSFEVQEHRIELDPEFDERLNNMPEGTVVRLYAAPVRDLTQKQLADAAAALATQHREPTDDR